MSYAERRRRKDGAAKTWQQLKAWHCTICLGKISQADYAARRNVAVRPGDGGLRFRLIHFACPPLPRLGAYLTEVQVRTRDAAAPSL